MSQYSHRLTLAVPEAFMAQANQLALIAGESPEDVNTFTNANWQDELGNLYAVCSAASKPIVLNMLSSGLPMQSSDSGVDYTLAQQALDKLVVYENGVLASAEKIVLAVDLLPLEVFAKLGLMPIEFTNELGVAE